MICRTKAPVLPLRSVGRPAFLGGRPRLQIVPCLQCFLEFAPPRRSAPTRTYVRTYVRAIPKQAVRNSQYWESVPGSFQSSACRRHRRNPQTVSLDENTSKQFAVSKPFADPLFPTDRGERASERAVGTRNNGNEEEGGMDSDEPSRSSIDQRLWGGGVSEFQ